MGASYNNNRPLIIIIIIIIVTFVQHHMQNYTGAGSKSQSEGMKTSIKNK